MIQPLLTITITLGRFGLLVIVALLTTGCGANLWETRFQASSLEVYPPVEAVEVIDCSRLGPDLLDQKSDQVEATGAKEIGFSQFEASATRHGARQEQLEEFAREIGATTVLYHRLFLYTERDLETRIRHEPVTTTSTYHTTKVVDGKKEHFTGTEYSTSYIPVAETVRTSTDIYRYLAIFYRDEDKATMADGP